MTPAIPPEPALLGCDFSSSPTTRKNIVLAFGRLVGGVVQLQKTENFASLAAWSARLQQGAWVGGFDLPFGLPRELVTSLGWPTTWEPCMRHFAGLSRTDIRALFKAFCDARPVGGKFAHRSTDRPAGSSPSMKWVNPPVAWMLHAGVPVLLDVGATLPGLHVGAPPPAPQRVALEAYPGLLARELLGGARSYKSDDTAKQTPERWLARKDLLTALEQGRTHLGLRLKLTPAQADGLLADASGDRLDAVLCLVQAAWGLRRHRAGDAWWGLPADLDPLEGWIVTA
jgi:Protein of unknown function (DUF429)